MASPASWSFSFPGSSLALLSPSNPFAAAGRSTDAELDADDDAEWVGGGPPLFWEPRCPRIHRPIPTSTTTSTAPRPSRAPEARGRPPGRRGPDGAPRRGGSGDSRQEVWPPGPDGVPSQSAPVGCDGSAGGGAGAGITRWRAPASAAGDVIPSPSPWSLWNSAWQVMSSTAEGTPARTWRGLQGRPSGDWGAGGSAGHPSPGQWAVSAA